MIWLLNRITDINGNYEEFLYTVNNANRSFILTEIRYTGNAAQGTGAFDRVQFTYTEKSNPQTQKGFISGASVTTPYLLNTIKITYVDDIVVTVKTYTCTYTTLHNQYFLQSFTEHETGIGKASYNPLIFTYGSNTAAADVDISGQYPGFGYNNTFTGDITGDGKQDLVAASYTIDNNGWTHYTGYTVIDEFINYGGSAGISIAYDQQFSTPGIATQIRGGKPYHNLLTSDYDGDSKDDVLITNWLLANTEILFTNVTINYSRYYNAIQGPTFKDVSYPDFPNALGQDYRYSYHGGTNFISGDFDGDGAKDYILIVGTNSSSKFKAFFSSPKKGIVNEEITGFGVEGSSSDPYYATSVASAADVIPIDFNADGTTEILVQKPTQSYVLSVYPVPPSSGYNYAAKTVCSTAAIKSGYRIFPGDFNGDGNADLLVRSSQTDPNGAWNILYSTGKDYISFPFIFQNKPFLDGDYSNVATSAHLLMVADLNNDGKSDVWHSLDDAVGGLHSIHTMYYSNGIPLSGQNSTSAFVIETYSRPESINKSKLTQTTAGDVNGDGKPDLLSVLNENSRIIYTKPFKEDRLLVKSTDGLGNQTSYDYGLITNSTFYQRSNAYEWDSPSQQPRLANKWQSLYGY